MKAKSRDYRKLKRARKRYRTTLDRTRNGYTKELLFADLRMKSVSRWFFNKYPESIPKFTIKWNGN